MKTKEVLFTLMACAILALFVSGLVLGTVMLVDYASPHLTLTSSPLLAGVVLFVVILCICLSRCFRITLK